VSIAGTPTTRSVAFAIAHATTKGVLVTAGTGNHGAKGCSPKQVGAPNAALYPASFADVVAVGGTEPNGRVWRCSHTGDYVDLVAPAKRYHPGRPRRFGHAPRPSTAAGASLMPPPWKSEV
jgi:hypothetical protein